MMNDFYTQESESQSYIQITCSSYRNISIRKYERIAQSRIKLFANKSAFDGLLKMDTSGKKRGVCLLPRLPLWRMTSLHCHTEIRNSCCWHGHSCKKWNDYSGTHLWELPYIWSTLNMCKTRIIWQPRAKLPDNSNTFLWRSTESNRIEPPSDCVFLKQVVPVCVSVVMMSLGRNRERRLFTYLFLDWALLV